MEAGQPDEVGALGEEAAGPLSLARPKSKPSGCGSFSLTLLGAVSFGVLTGLIQREWGGALMLLTDWSKDTANDAIKILLGLTGWGLWSGANFLLRQRRLNDPRSPQLHLALEKRMPKQRPMPPVETQSVQEPVRLDYTFEVWRANTFLRRALSPVVFCSAGATLLFCAATCSRRWDCIALSALSLLCWLGGLPDLKSIFRPLLRLDEKGVEVEGRAIDWERIQRVEVEHLLNFQGVYYATCWVTSDEAGRRRTRISIPKTRCSQLGEEELLAFAARKLNVPLPAVAPSPPDSL